MNYLFGPVPSRRLGVSLGIDLLKAKICSFDCIYCEVAPTGDKTMKRDEYVPADEVLAELREYLVENFNNLDFITFSGSGEPTLHSRIGYIIREIKKMTDVPVCVLTNSTLLIDPAVREEISAADLVIPSVDAVSPALVEAVNKPLPGFDMQTIVEAIKKFKEEYSTHIWLEILLCGGINDTDDEFARFAEIVKYINPEKVQINTVARPSMAYEAHPVPAERIKVLADMLGDKADIIQPFSKRRSEVNGRSAEELTVTLLKIRSCHLDEIARATGLNGENLDNLLAKLTADGRITRVEFNGLSYYKITGA